MVQLVLGMSELPRPDDAADALAIATWAANTDRGSGARRRPRSWTAPPSRRSPAASRATTARSARPSPGTSGAARPEAQRLLRDRPVIASVEGTVGAVAFDSLVIEVGGIGYRVFAAPAILASAQPGRGSSCTRTTSSARTSRRCTASGRPRSSGSSTCCSRSTAWARRSRWRSSARGRPPTCSSRSWPRTRRCWSSIPGIGKKLAERIIFELKEKVTAAGVAVVGPVALGGDGRRGRDRRGAAGARLLAGRGAGGIAGGARRVGVGSTLEERVKAALRSLLRE